ncbi:MAG TPA: PAS domain-containing protein [Thermoplasmata archaeon]|nr:PAS domain-containing protein [Thermoplasmata archaeon]
MAAKKPLEWFDELPCSVTVCDRAYTILYLNDRSAEINASDGGKSLVGKNLLECHPPDARRELRHVMAAKRPNVYSIEKGGKKKVIFQAHWKRRGRPAGLVEITFELPRRMPHFVRS